MSKEELHNNLDFETTDKIMDMGSRINTSNALKTVLPQVNQEVEDLSNFLDLKEDVFTEKLKNYGVELLKELAERTNALQRLSKVLETESDEVFHSDIELCEEFINDTNEFLTKVKTFRSSN